MYIYIYITCRVMHSLCKNKIGQQITITIDDMYRGEKIIM